MGAPQPTLPSKAEIGLALAPHRLHGLCDRSRFLVCIVTRRDDIIGPRGEKPSDIGAITISSDGHLVAGNMYLGTARDWDADWSAALNIARLTKEQRALAHQMRADRTDDYRP